MLYEVITTFKHGKVGNYIPGLHLFIKSLFLGQVSNTVTNIIGRTMTEYVYSAFSWFDDIQHP